ncbi:MAG TPA: guanylate kinase [Ruminococcaceae bacterium]|jgi:guanylate kinase|nr:guanylate kinase [Oscillospiraceae bacterium]
MANKGLLVVLSGPSGTGKGTVLKALLARCENVRLSISATTRAPRPGEADGREYYFMTREKFTQTAAAGGMLESAEYCGNFYGTPAAPVERWREQGLDVVLEIETVGGAQVQRKRPDAVGIFILPPSLRELARRLRGRATEPEAAVERRLAAARTEIRRAKEYDYVVVNDSVERAADEIRAILTAEKDRVERNPQMIERILTE